MKPREAKKAFHVGGILGNLQPPDLIFLCVPDLAKGQKRLVTELAQVQVFCRRILRTSRPANNDVEAREYFNEQENKKYAVTR